MSLRPTPAPSRPPMPTPCTDAQDPPLVSFKNVNNARTTHAVKSCARRIGQAAPTFKSRTEAPSINSNGTNW
jgi:hypothetical protein